MPSWGPEIVASHQLALKARYPDPFFWPHSIAGEATPLAQHSKSAVRALTAEASWMKPAPWAPAMAQALDERTLRSLALPVRK